MCLIAQGVFGIPNGTAGTARGVPNSLLPIVLVLDVGRSQFNRPRAQLHQGFFRTPNLEYENE